MNTIKEYVQKHSINTLKLGTITAKVNDVCTVRVGIRDMEATFAAGKVGEVVSIQCPDGEDSKSYIVGSIDIGFGTGGNVAI